MSHKPLIVGNWKMHKTPSQTEAHIASLVKAVGSSPGKVDIAVAPPFVSLHAARAGLEGHPVALAAQDVCWETEGPFTGEISAPMLRETGCSLVIVGHSERREHFGESDRQVNRKAKAVLGAGMTPIICVGEQLSEREAGTAFQVVGRQLQLALAGISLEPSGSLVIAYEPVWAIGTGKTAKPEEAEEMHRHLRKELASALPGSGESVRILYGGSVSGANIGSLLARPEISGALVGGASLDPSSFAEICKVAAGA